MDYKLALELEMELLPYRARFYDPGVGRFIQKDPIGFEGGDVNLYGYVGNDPVNWVDPTGLTKGGKQKVMTTRRAGGLRKAPKRG